MNLGVESTFPRVLNKCADAFTVKVGNVKKRRAADSTEVEDPLIVQEFRWHNSEARGLQYSAMGAQRNGLSLWGNLL